MPRLRVIYPIVLTLGTPSLFADQVAFKNGDRLSGAILKSNAETLVIKTVVAGEVTCLMAVSGSSVGPAAPCGIRERENVGG